MAPCNLGLNGNAITVSPALHATMVAEIDGDRFDPMATALALSRVVASRRKRGAEPLTFGMTFPFSTHNYQLRFCMAAGGVDPDQDVRLVVLPPPFMADSIASGQVDGFCVGAPWQFDRGRSGVGQIRHFVSDILDRAAEKVRAVRRTWSEKKIRRFWQPWCGRQPARPNSIGRTAKPDRGCASSARPENIGVDANVGLRTLEGRLKISPMAPSAKAAAIC